MATGKTSVGRLVATELGRRFVDLDAEIERTAGRSIPDIFKTDGEPAFRRLEAEVLGKQLDTRGAVIATGGGTPCAGDNLERMRNAGLVVALEASLETILGRAAPGTTGRPLLENADAAKQLYAERASVYSRAHAIVKTDGLSVEAVATEVARRANLRLGHATVRLGERSYPIRLAALKSLGALCKELLPGATQLAIITDDNVKKHGHAQAAKDSVERAGFKCTIVTIPAGEVSKQLSTVAWVADELARAGLDRKSAILAVGGGVVGDLAGFVASTLFRGIPYAQVPTTLLAMVDSSIGGKTAVDLPSGKNLVGAFWQPRFVLADVETLATLPVRERRAAMAEVMKTGLLADPELVSRLETHGEAIALEDAVWRCARMKAEVVSADERELTGRRVFLNLGHTVGHAIETYAKTLVHGECVALGLVAAARVSERLKLSVVGLEARVTAALKRLGLDTNLEPWLKPDVLQIIGTDKKRAGKTLTYVALEDVGRPKTVDLTVDDLGDLLRGVRPSG